MTEDEFATWVLDVAHLGGWLAFHARPAANRRGQYTTPMAGDPGFPDWVLVHAQHGVIFAELKGDGGRPSEAQLRWLGAIEHWRETCELMEATAPRHFGAPESYLWWPKDQPFIAGRLLGHVPRLVRQVL